jgi:hypothetical protein
MLLQQGALERLDYREVFGDVNVLISYPFGDLDFTGWTALDHNADISGAWIPYGQTTFE